MKRALSIFVISLLFAVGANAKAKDIIGNSQRSHVGDQENGTVEIVLPFSLHQAPPNSGVFCL